MHYCVLYIYPLLSTDRSQEKEEKTTAPGKKRQAAASVWHYIGATTLVWSVQTWDFCLFSQFCLFDQLLSAGNAATVEH